MLKAVIIDDESNARESIANLSRLTNSEIEIVGEADGVKTGLAVIVKMKPDLVFLDIQLEDGTGFELLEQIEKIEFHIIFITAFNEYAIKISL